MKSQTILVTIETPKGSTEKYAFDKSLGGYRLKKILPAGMMFPYDFGFLPGTEGEDGDPLDVIVFSEFESFPGCIIECRLLGAFNAKQGKSKKEMIRNDRYIAVPVLERSDPPQLTEQLKKEVIDFFINYNKIEKKYFEPLGFVKPRKALHQIRKGKK